LQWRRGKRRRRKKTMQSQYPYTCINNSHNGIQPTRMGVDLKNDTENDTCG
jgi:hypothetical protein